MHADAFAVPALGLSSVPAVHIVTMPQSASGWYEQREVRGGMVCHITRS